MTTLPADTIEQIEVTIQTTADPTGSPPLFSVGQDQDFGTPVAGAWLEAWDGSGRILALTPLIGRAQALDIDRGVYRLYAQWTVGSQRPVRVADVITFT